MSENYKKVPTESNQIAEMFDKAHKEGLEKLSFAGYVPLVVFAGKETNMLFSTPSEHLTFDDYAQKVLAEAQPIEGRPAAPLAMLDLKEPWEDQGIFAATLDFGIAEPAEIASLLSLQLQGEDGYLRTDGNGNLFFLDQMPVRATWNQEKSAWLLSVDWPTDANWCPAGTRVFVPATHRAKKLQ